MIGYFRPHIFQPGTRVTLKEDIQIRVIQGASSLKKGSVGEIVGIRNQSAADVVSLYQVNFCSKEFDGDILDIPEYLLST